MTRHINKDTVKEIIHAQLNKVEAAGFTLKYKWKAGGKEWKYQAPNISYKKDQIYMTSEIWVAKDLANINVYM
jgi:hypothetical protein